MRSLRKENSSNATTVTYAKLLSGKNKKGKGAYFPGDFLGTWLPGGTSFQRRNLLQNESAPAKFRIWSRQGIAFYSLANVGI